MSELTGEKEGKKTLKKDSKELPEKNWSLKAIKNISCLKPIAGH